MDRHSRHIQTLACAFGFVYALVLAPLSLIMAVVLFGVNTLGRGDDRFWPIRWWTLMISSLPRVVEWCEKRLAAWYARRA